MDNDWEKQFDEKCMNGDFGGGINVYEIKSFISKLLESARETERNEIFNKFIIEGSAMTMFSTNEGVLFAAEELRKSMVRICKKEKLAEQSEEKA